MRVALLQIDPTAGDIGGNAVLIVRAARTAQALGAELAVTPELALMGYLPRDLLMNRGFVLRCREALERMAAELAGGPPLLVGVATPNPAEMGRPLFNSAVLLKDGAVGQAFHKTLLPTYDVFDEDRYFEPAHGAQILELNGWRLGISICEDVWNDRDFWLRRRYHSDPIEVLAGAGAQAILNLSASPFVAGKQALREEMLGHLAQRHRLPVAYVNQVGGNDDLVFDGRSCAFDAQGRLMARARSFEEDVLLVDLPSAAGTVAEDDFATESEIWRALVLGVRDYARKTRFSSVLLGLSGGIDSALTAAIAADAVGKEQVLCVLMPSPYSSQGSVDDSLELAKNLGLRTLALPISGLMQAYGQTLEEAFRGRAADVTEENLQSRIRGNLLMALSNKYGSLLLSTGNKSELSVGYCTLYGDTNGGLAVISDVPKTWVYKIAREINAERPVIPESTLRKPPSAELRPGQIDQDSLPPYDVLDEILAAHVEDGLDTQALVAAGFERAVVEKVLRLVRISEYKRRQLPPGLKITSKAFGTGRRYPVAQGFRG